MIGHDITLVSHIVILLTAVVGLATNLVILRKHLMQQDRKLDEIHTEVVRAGNGKNGDGLRTYEA